MSDEYATISEPAASQPDSAVRHDGVPGTGHSGLAGPGPELDPRTREASAIALHSSAAYFVVPTVLDAARSLASILIIALFVLTFIAQPFRIPSESMERTLLVGDFLLVNKMLYAPPGPWRTLLPTATWLAATWWSSAFPSIPPTTW